ncbi:MAG: HD domain-containing phosphohydrolase, partial [Bacillota bacterium]
LYNRRYFEEEILRIDTARQLPISIISGDVNGLKLTNDVFGHANGDELIKTAAHYIQDCCRAEDAVVRFGGDEFMVVLPKCDEATAGDIVERIQAQCRDKTSAGLPVSLALGAATKTETSEDINTIVNIAESRMYKNKSHDLERVRLDTLEALERTVYEKDNKMDHALRLRDLAIGFSGYLQLSNGTVSDVALLATLHDIGKIAIPDEIINKTGSLSAEEWAIVQTHAEIGNRILRATRLVSFAVEQGVLSHHEHWNGSGYPNGLRAEAIPFISRVIAIIDAYDVMTNDRAYRQAITNKQAIAELRRCAGSQFDPELVAKFVEFIGA